MALLLAVRPAFALPNLMRSFANPLFLLVVHGRLMLLSGLSDRSALRGVSGEELGMARPLALHNPAADANGKRGDLR
jgi:hypothetical protein